MPATRTVSSITQERKNYDPYRSIQVRENDEGPLLCTLDNVPHTRKPDAVDIGERFLKFYSHLRKPEYTQPPPKHLKPNDPRPPPLRLADLRALRTLGCGVSGSVVYAKTTRHTHPLDRPGSIFAVKIVEKKWFRDTDQNEDDCPEFKQTERSILTELPWNPFTCGLIGTFIDELNVYYAFEFGQTSLREVLLHERLEPRVVQFFFCGIVAGIAFLHDHDIIHRDLKPENIFLGPGGYPVIGDFGTARRMQDDFFQLEQDQDGVRIASPVACFDWREVGTAAYNAPEQNATTPADADYFGVSVDWWAAGVILYELLTRRFPFYSHSDDRLTAMIKRARYRWPSSFRIGQMAKALVAALLNPNPLERLGTYGTQEVMNHPWFKNIDWAKIQSRQYISPYKNLYLGPGERWHELPLPKQQNVPGLQIAEPPLELRNDNRFKRADV